ncbi:aldehyde dehydrogenase family protein [Pelomonas sp. SE-A7]|uniref:aldehyde dehydrogenase family protein n=1 Tax=Pelomonas sp. SE-A7 TaxID=3054953 RepID=UPI00259CF797|nr:aldehyde dehydrogenase family protein [Pelomonas sp. SE-A7]MDM4766853.1 aldehyde dehydrogenase family protein [Pelomonas sp. SE-A7]
MSTPESVQKPVLPSACIEGQRLNSTAIRLPIHAAASGEVIAWQQVASPDQIDQAVASARASLPAWRDAPVAYRGQLLAAVAERIEARRRVLVQWQMQVNGKPRAEAEQDVSDVAACFAYYAGLCLQCDAFAVEPVELPDSSVSARRERVAVGVAALIVPWNFPMVTTAWKLAPALAAGCSVVLKPSELSSPAEQALFELLAEAGMPPGVVNLVNGGAEVGAALVANGQVDKISFTGSTAVGQRIMREAAGGMKRLTLELGGKSALIVRADADIALAVQLAVAGAFANAGQMCSATSRILVHDEVYRRFMSEFETAVRALVVGPPGHEASQMGPLISAAQLARVRALLDQGLDAGAQIAFAGRVAERADDGFFMAPVVVAEPPSDNVLWREEVFGPVACVRSFRDDDEALALANDSPYGLVATVVTEDAEAAERFSTELRAGLVWVNTPQLIFPQVCWGGLGASGVGRELGLEGLRAFQELRHVVRRN